MEGRNVRLHSQQRIELRPDVEEIVAALVKNIMALATLASHSNRDSNSLGGILTTYRRAGLLSFYRGQLPQSLLPALQLLSLPVWRFP